MQHLKLTYRGPYIWDEFIAPNNELLEVVTLNNPCTQMAIRFSLEMKIESKNYSIAIFIYSKIEKKKFNTNVLLLLFFIQIARK